MLFEFNRFSSLLLIFFVHGLVYALLLFRKGVINETRSDKWLSLFLFLCILYIAPWMLGFAGWYDTQPYRDLLFYLPFQHLYFIGPVMFFYVQALLNPSFRFGKNEWLHLVPGLLYLLFCVVMVVTDKLVKKEYYFLAGGADPDFDTWYQLSGFVSMLVYFILSLRYYNLYKKLIVQVVSYAEAVLFRWVRHFLVAFLSMLTVRVFFFILGEFTDLGYWDTWWYFLVFAILFYYIAISGYANSVETKIAFSPHLLTYRPALLLNYGHEGTAEETEILAIETVKKESMADREALTEWKSRLLHFVEDQRMFEDPELSLSQLAKALQSNPSVVSKMVNQGFGLNFNDFVNQFRIEAVKEKLKAGEQRQQTLLGIAYDCGFNSKATFNRAFKKATGLSPREWLQKI